ncbi:bifunctional glutamate N-acetyltransferase/amino-acid acetyltransferase ArgJ [Roseimaritima ulvae]|uniref:Arginine biosynthesis bifunctional protein ArgJ n=1 Tax=Roseimaritima ulvae TaxID=980254 RepID=A0A5B9QZZ9_9BACT|nr:bifunctional glutamate N-acetyltransferase/amino-acid acetyltransferase ArgJ [Roseimaritima ulvae]QEG39583.1 Arginine biosynthesis bifunctional protein ArgJ [Roseimaritima ulvae]
MTQPTGPEATANLELNEAELPAGYRFAGVACGIKASGRADLSLLVSDQPVVAAGVFTTNQVVAAPVLLCKARTPSATVRAVVVNSGNANACTGKQGEADAQQMTQWVAEKLGIADDAVLVMSTGVIGHTLPMTKIEQGIAAAHQQLAASPDAFHLAADAILTTDKSRKVASRTVKIGKQSYHIAGMAKGAGMISPNMATMLATVITDAPLSPEDAQSLLATSADLSFNRVSVDGHTSTNDTLLLLAHASPKPLAEDDLQVFQNALTEMCIELAKQLPADGEGAKHVLQLTVSGAASDEDAAVIARTVAASPLVKTALTGGDPNWGRIVSAAGYAGPPISVPQTCLTILNTPVFTDGQPVAFDAAKLSEAMKAEPFVSVRLVVGSGPGQAKFWASDLTTDYVEFNSLYTT